MNVIRGYSLTTPFDRRLINSQIVDDSILPVTCVAQRQRNCMGENPESLRFPNPQESAIKLLQIDLTVENEIYERNNARSYS